MSSITNQVKLQEGYIPIASELLPNSQGKVNNQGMHIPDLDLLDAKNILPTVTGYTSFFGLNSIMGTPTTEKVQEVLTYRTFEGNSLQLALASDGLYIRSLNGEGVAILNDTADLLTVSLADSVGMSWTKVIANIALNPWKLWTYALLKNKLYLYQKGLGRILRLSGTRFGQFTIEKLNPTFIVGDGQRITITLRSEDDSRSPQADTYKSFELLHDGVSVGYYRLPLGNAAAVSSSQDRWANLFTLGGFLSPVFTENSRTEQTAISEYRDLPAALATTSEVKASVNGAKSSILAEYFGVDSSQNDVQAYHVTIPAGTLRSQGVNVTVGTTTRNIPLGSIGTITGSYKNPHIIAGNAALDDDSRVYVYEYKFETEFYVFVRRHTDSSLAYDIDIPGAVVTPITTGVQKLQEFQDIKAEYNMDFVAATGNKIATPVCYRAAMGPTIQNTIDNLIAAQPWITQTGPAQVKITQTVPRNDFTYIIVQNGSAGCCYDINSPDGNPTAAEHGTSYMLHPLDYSGFYTVSAPTFVEGDLVSPPYLRIESFLAGDTSAAFLEFLDAAGETLGTYTIPLNSLTNDANDLMDKLTLTLPGTETKIQISYAVVNYEIKLYYPIADAVTVPTYALVQDGTTIWEGDPLVTEPFALPQVEGIFKARGRLGAWTRENFIHWSSATNPVDFTPNKQTQANQVTVNAILGNIVKVEGYENGFNIFASGNVVNARYVGGQAIFSFDPIDNAAGVIDPRHIAADEYNHFYWSQKGMVQIDANAKIPKAEPVMQEFTDWLNHYKYPITIKQMGNRFIVIEIQYTYNTFDLRKVRLESTPSLVAQGKVAPIITHNTPFVFPIVLYGLNLYPTYKRALIFDTVLGKWGSCDEEHTAIYSLNPINQQGFAIEKDFNLFDAELGTENRGIGLLKPNGQHYICDVKSSDSYVLFGKYAVHRETYTKLVSLFAEFVNVPDCVLQLEKSINNRTIEEIVQSPTIDELSYRFHPNLAGLWYNVLVRGTNFHLKRLMTKGYSYGRSSSWE